jgi:hypothetical protein
MPLACDKCKRDSGLSGTANGYWMCGPCEEAARIRKRLAAIAETHESREAIRLGNMCILVPGARLPLSTTDAEAQAFADENYGIKWERTDKDVIIWCEM